MEQVIQGLSNLKFENVYKSFKQGNIITNVLNGITIQFEQSFSYSIVGVSGTGKSTMIHLLAGLEKPTQGKILFNNFDINSFSSAQKHIFLQKNIGLIFQLPYLLNELSVLENVMVKGLIADFTADDLKAKAYFLLERVGLIDKSDFSPEKLSGGEQQRVAIARALFNKPDFLLADEPTAHLDEKTKFSILELLLKLQQEWKMGLIIASHDKAVSQSLGIQIELINGRTRTL